jgi:hypothetical protein
MPPDAVTQYIRVKQQFITTENLFSSKWLYLGVYFHAMTNALHVVSRTVLNDTLCEKFAAHSSLNVGCFTDLRMQNYRLRVHKIT